MSTARIRVLIVDDSAVVRGLLARALETDPAIEIAGTAMHGDAALTWMRRHPVDVVVLDVEMPVMDGLETLQHIQREFPKLPVIMASALTFEGAKTTVRALALGAAGCIAKPQASSMHASIQQLVTELVPLVKALGKGAIARSRPAAPVFTPSRKHVEPAMPPKIVVIGASTGGPQALTRVLSGLPRDFPLPILIVQHMPPMFTPMLAKHLAQDTGRPCAEGRNGGVIESGHMYVAPGDFHMLIAKTGDRMVTVLNQAEPEHYCRPSVNPLFRSAAEWYGKSVLAVMLTGMGEDGLEGTQAVFERQGFVIAQDEASSVVWGMPGAIVRRNLTHQVLPLTEISNEINRLCLQEVVH